MVCRLYQREPRKTRGAATGCACGGILSAGVCVGEALERPASNAAAAAVSRLRVRAHGAAGPTAGAGGSRSGAASGIRRDASGAAGRGNRGAACEPWERSAGGAASLFEGGAVGAGEGRANDGDGGDPGAAQG